MDPASAEAALSHVYVFFHQVIRVKLGTCAPVSDDEVDCTCVRRPGQELELNCNIVLKCSLIS